MSRGLSDLELHNVWQVARVTSCVQREIARFCSPGSHSTGTCSMPHCTIDPPLRSSGAPQPTTQAHTSTATDLAPTASTMAQPLSLQAEVSRTTRLFADPLVSSSKPVLVPLSLTDSVSVSAPGPSGLWIWDAGQSAASRAALHVDLLSTSLQRTLTFFPFLCGQLQPAPYKPGWGPAYRIGSLALGYNNKDDPGIHLVVASSKRSLSSVLPNSEERSSAGMVDVTALPENEFFPQQLLALHNGVDYAGLPCMLVQITRFECGGVAVAVRVSHGLFDTSSLSTFVHHWAACNRAALDIASASDGFVPPPPVFEPALLDRYTAASDGTGDVNQPLRLPMLRFDWWNSSEDCPPFLMERTVVPAQLDKQSIGPPGPAVPWHSWRWMDACAHVLFDFSAEEVEAIWSAAKVDVASRISHLDALVAHVWQEIARARGVEPDEQPIHLTVALGLRDRVKPVLPSGFVGSTMIMTPTTMTGATLCQQSLGEVAAAIRHTVDSFTPRTVPWLLHELAAEISPQRACRILFGRHTIVASWLRLSVQEVDFGQKKAPCFFDAVFPFLADNACYAFETPSGTGAEGRGRRGITLSLMLDTHVMDNLKGSSTLRRFRGSVPSVRPDIVEPFDVKLVARAMFAAMDADGFAACLPFLAPRATWWSASAGDIPLASIAPISQAMSAHVKGRMRLTVLDVVAEGHKVAAEVEAYADMRDGRVYNNKYHYKLLFDDMGKVKEVKEYLDTRLAAQVWHALLGIE